MRSYLLYNLSDGGMTATFGEIRERSGMSNTEIERIVSEVPLEPESVSHEFTGTRASIMKSMADHLNWNWVASPYNCGCRNLVALVRACPLRLLIIPGLVHVLDCKTTITRRDVKIRNFKDVLT